MAKKSGKKQAKGTKTGTDKKKASRRAPVSSHADEIPKPMPEKPAATKSGNPECSFCGKAMKDAKTKKIHERNCQAKSQAPVKQDKKELDAAVLDLKDQFRDQVDTMSRMMREREEQHQQELEEVRTVLRMEVDRHRKELERISKVEKEVAEERQQPPEPAKEIPAAEAKPQADAPREHAQVRDKQPKAIDLVPLPVPHLPRKREPVPDEDAIPDIDEESAPADTQPRAPGLDRNMVEDIVRGIVKDLLPEQGAPGASDKLMERMTQLSARLDYTDQKLERNSTELHRDIDRIGKEVELKRIEKELEKISERVLDIMEDSGYGESLSVSKIPPTILEIVYQAIIDDVYVEIVRTKGPQDAERFARSALEEVRLKTSGSELFRFDGRKIVTDNLAKSIEANLISARQIQTTYDVLLERLLETVPHHKAKNFKGMIKVKSQEFAVDRATKLTKETAKLEKILESTSQMVAAMSSNFNNQALELHEAVNNLREKEMALKADREELEALRTKLDEGNERYARLADELALSKAASEMKAEIEEAAVEKPEEPLLAPGEEPFIAAPETAPPEAGEMTAETADMIAMQNEAILSAIGKGVDSRRGLLKETGLDEALMLQRISELVERNKIIEKKSGKKIRYTTLEKEMDKAKEEAPAPAEEAVPPEEPKKEKKARKKKGVAKEQTEHEDVEPAPEEIKAPEPEIIIPPDEPAPEPAQESVEEKAPEPEEPAKPKKVSKKVPAKEKKQKPRAKDKKEEAKDLPEEPVPEEPAEVLETPKSKAKRTAEPEEEAEPVREPVTGDLPTETKKLDDLSDEERQVLDSITAEGMTVSGIQSKVGKHLKRFALLRALRVLIDSGFVGIITKGRMELYYKINVEKMDKSDNSERKTEVK